MSQEYGDVRDLRDGFRAAGTLGETIPSTTVKDEKRMRGEVIDRLVRTAVFAEQTSLREAARYAVRAAAVALGAYPASIHALYMAVGRREGGGFTVPAMNLRGATYDVARAVFRTAKRLEAGAFIFEIARSEIGYTMQRPAEYAACVLAAAVKEGHHGPVFIQGDHFQAKSKVFREAPEKETQALRDLIDEAILAGFFNIDIDCSTLVDLAHATVAEQQRINSELTADFTKYIRQREPKGLTVSVGGEIGEVGKKNSTLEEMGAFLDGYRQALEGNGDGGGRDGKLAGISKISIQTGTSHGGTVGPDGKVVQVDVDFDTLERLSRAAIDEYGLGGAVQHGASTLPEDLFHKFPETKTIEIHLATEFQNIMFDRLPDELRGRIYAWLAENAKEERKKGMTDEQFHYKARKKGFGPFKREWWNLPDAVRGEIATALEGKFERLFGKLRVGGTAALTERHVKPVAVPLGAPEALQEAVS